MIKYVVADDAEIGEPDQEQVIGKVNSSTVQFRVKVDKGAKCTFSYSEERNNFTEVEGAFPTVPGKWIGAKVGLVPVKEKKINDSGYADIDWFSFSK